jgi:LEA14-like dessication related protein
MPQHPIKKNLTFLCVRSLLLLAVVTGMTGLSGCATLERMIQKPTATFSGMQMTNANLFKSTAVFSFNINNPNPIDIRTRHITYDLKLNGRDFVSGQLDQGVTLTAGGTSTLQVPVTMAYLDFFESMSQLWSAGSADYTLTGGFTVGPFVIPFQAHGVFDLPNMPKLTLESIKIQNLSFSGATLQCRLKMNNPNAFDLLFKKLDYTLSLGGTSLGRASALPSGPIGKNSNSTVALALDVSFAQLGRSVYQLLQGAKADYKLDGGLIFDQPGSGESKAPFYLSGRTPLLH